MTSLFSASLYASLIPELVSYMSNSRILARLTLDDAACSLYVSVENDIFLRVHVSVVKFPEQIFALYRPKQALQQLKIGFK